MRSPRFVCMIVSTLLVIPTTRGRAQPGPTIEQFLGAGFPSELVAARKVDRIAWIAWERGLRNVYTAAAPDYVPSRITTFLKDDGIVITNLSIADDGSTVAFLRGGMPNRVGWIANVASNPDGVEMAIWAARTDGGGSWRVARNGVPMLSPDGRWVAFARDSQIYRARVVQGQSTSARDRGEEPLIRVWGRNFNPQWSPDGSKIAFVSDRLDHSFVGVYDVQRRSVTYMAAGVDRDASPTWSEDSKQIAFIRRPGLAFGQQTHEGAGGLGDPPGPGRAAGIGGGREGAPGSLPRARWPNTPGLRQAAFVGGYTLSFWTADARTGEGREIWHNQPNDALFANVNSIRWVGESLLFQHEPQEWVRYYSVNVNGTTSTPLELTPGSGQVETVGFSPDRTTLYYASNVGDIDRRHLWKVPAAGGQATQITSGNGIEMYPTPLASGRAVAFLAAGAAQPLSVSIAPATGGQARTIYPKLPRDFPVAAHVVPQNVVLRAEDGLEFHNQLFLPRDDRAAGRRPALIFVHGGPSRQMLLGYHYMDFYHMAYAVNQWFANQGYVVLSVNFRRGIGYGKSFRTAQNSAERGNAEYLDVLAAGKYLQSRPDVDPARIGIWGLSYGGILTAQALARNSDIFAAGVDMAGIHLWGSSLDSTEVAFNSSSISSIGKWKSPVFLWHGDDDRNVQFSQTTGLVQLLRAHNVPFELMVLPDDTHETLLYSRWLETYARIQDFLRRHLKERTTQ